MLQSIWSFYEHRDEDGPADAWQRIEDGHVTMLLPLSRHVLSFLSTNRFGELLAEPIELLFRVSQLAIDDPQLHDHHSDVSSGSLPGPLSDAQGRLAQLTDHMGRVETTDAIALENASNALLARTRSLLGRGDRFPQIERPVSAEVVGEFQHLGIVAPQLIPQPVCQPETLYLEFFIDARPFPELDNERLDGSVYGTAAYRS